VANEEADIEVNVAVVVGGEEEDADEDEAANAVVPGVDAGAPMDALRASSEGIAGTLEPTINAAGDPVHTDCTGFAGVPGCVDTVLPVAGVVL
jgi:hypothetical protein